RSPLAPVLALLSRWRAFAGRLARPEHTLAIVGRKAGDARDLAGALLAGEPGVPTPLLVNQDGANHLRSAGAVVLNPTSAGAIAVPVVHVESQGRARAHGWQLAVSCEDSGAGEARWKVESDTVLVAWRLGGEAPDERDEAVFRISGSCGHA